MPVRIGVVRIERIAGHENLRATACAGPSSEISGFSASPECESAEAGRLQG
jgi:hypothetical protein